MADIITFVESYKSAYVVKNVCRHYPCVHGYRNTSCAGFRRSAPCMPDTPESRAYTKLKGYTLMEKQR